MFAQGHAFSAWKVERSVGIKTLEEVVKQRDQIDMVEKIGA